MKKLMNKSLCAWIIIFLMITYAFPIISSAQTSYNTYLALGDSIAYGYGLPDKDKESYAAKVREKYNIEISNFKNLAVSGMTCEEFYTIIQKNEYTQAIKSSQLITISIGSNELLGIVTMAVSEVTGIPKNDPAFLTKAQEVFLNAGVLDKAKMLSAIYNFFTSEETKVTIENAIKTYQDNWIKSVKYIKEVNPNAIIVATEFYNPYYEFALYKYDLGGFVDEYIQKMNKILTDYSNSESEYKIAKIYSAFNTTNPRITNVNISTTNFNLDPHPNVLGHEIICTKILDALSNVTTSKKNIATLTISDIVDRTYTGEKIEPEITIKDGGKQLVKDKDFTVSYSNNIEIGEAKVTIIGIGNYQGNVTKTFNIKSMEQKEISKLSIESVEEQTYTGIKIVPDVKIMDGTKKLIKDTDYELKYNDNINVGNATIVISGIGNYIGTEKLNFKIVEKYIDTVEVEDIPEQIYTGKEIKPTIVVKDASAKLIESVDYMVTYTDNIDVGKATVSITGKGNYRGTLEKEFNIIENNQTELKDISNLQITEIENKIYTGKLITPEVRVKDGEKILIKNIDYTISYNNNINIGTATATITGIGKYMGKVEKNFEIERKDINYTTIEDISDQMYTGDKIQPQIKISSDSILLKQGQDYMVEYTNNMEEGTAIIQIKGIGNYTGTTTKTFNIVNLDNKEKGEEDKKDETLANKPIPNTGKKVVILMLIVGTMTIGIILFIKLKEYKKLNI